MMDRVHIQHSLHNQPKLMCNSITLCSSFLFPLTRESKSELKNKTKQNKKLYLL